MLTSNEGPAHGQTSSTPQPNEGRPNILDREITRRDFLRLGVLAGVSLAAAACGFPTPQPGQGEATPSSQDEAQRKNGIPIASYNILSKYDANNDGVVETEEDPLQGKYGSLKSAYKITAFEDFSKPPNSMVMYTYQMDNGKSRGIVRPMVGNVIKGDTYEYSSRFVFDSKSKEVALESSINVEGSSTPTTFFKFGVNTNGNSQEMTDLVKKANAGDTDSRKAMDSLFQLFKGDVNYYLYNPATNISSTIPASKKANLLESVLNFFVMPVAAAAPESTATTPATKPTTAPKQTEVPPTAVPSVEQLPATKTAATEFANAMTAVGTATTAEQILAQGLVTKEITGGDGKKYEVAFTQDGHPLMMKREGGEWNIVDQRNSDEATEQITGAHYESRFKAGSTYRQALNEYSNIEIATASQWQWVFQDPKAPIFTDLKNNSFGILDENTHLGLFNALSWGNRSSLPKWLVEGNFSSDQLKAILVEDITAYAKFLAPYKPSNVVVANEVLGNPVYAGPDFWVEKLGMDEYLKTVFHIARNELPKGTRLILNDFANNYSGAPRSEELFKLVQRLNNEEKSNTGRELIDAVGMQSPLLLLIGDYSPEERALLDPTSPEASQLLDRYEDMIKRYKEIGVDVVVSETLVDQRPLTGSSAEKLKKQAELYYEFALRTYKNKIPLFIFGPKNDDTTYPEGLDSAHNEANPYLVDDAGAKTLAYFEVIKAKFDAGN